MAQEGKRYGEAFCQIKKKKVGWFGTGTRGYKEKMKNILVVMKSVRRNAELTSFTFSTSAAAHIINIRVSSYSSSTRQHMGERCGMQRGREERRISALPVIFVDSTGGLCGV